MQIPCHLTSENCKWYFSNCYLLLWILIPAGASGTDAPYIVKNYCTQRPQSSLMNHKEISRSLSLRGQWSLLYCSSNYLSFALKKPISSSQGLLCFTNCQIRGPNSALFNKAEGWRDKYLGGQICRQPWKCLESQQQRDCSHRPPQSLFSALKYTGPILCPGEAEKLQYYQKPSGSCAQYPTSLTFCHPKKGL